jgi:hypothetical protein
LIERTILTVRTAPSVRTWEETGDSHTLEPRKVMYRVPPLLPPGDVHHYPTRKGKNFTSNQISSFSTPFTACTVRNVAAVPTLAQPLGPYFVQRNPSTIKPSIYVLYEVLSMFQLHPISNKENPTSPAWHGMEHQDVLPGGFLASLLCMQADASGSLYETLGGESYSQS